MRSIGQVGKNNGEVNIMKRSTVFIICALLVILASGCSNPASKTGGSTSSGVQQGIKQTIIGTWGVISMNVNGVTNKASAGDIASGNLITYVFGESNVHENVPGVGEVDGTYTWTGPDTIRIVAPTYTKQNANGSNTEIGGTADYKVRLDNGNLVFSIPGYGDWTVWKRLK